MKISQVVSSIALAAIVTIGVSFIAPTQVNSAVLDIKDFSQGNLGTVYINPYNVAPLTAIINRAGKNIEKIHVRVIAKKGGVDVSYSVSRGALLNHDGIPVFGLYSDYTNKVEVTYLYMGKKQKEIYKIQTAPIAGVVRDGRFGSFPNRVVKKVAKGFENRLYFINHTLESVHRPLQWLGGSGAAQWNDYTENFIVDTKGEIRWYLDYKQFYDRTERNVDRGGMVMGIHQLNNGDIAFTQAQKYFRYDLMGKKVFERKLPFGYIDSSHETLTMDNGHMLLRVAKYHYKLPNGKTVNTVRDHIIEVDETGKVVEEWSLPKIFGKNQMRKNLIMALDARAVCLNVDMNAHEIEVKDDLPYGDITSTGAGRNWAHVNSMEYDKQDDSIILSLRHQGIVKITRDKKIKWIMASAEGWSKEFKAKILKPIDSNGKSIICEDNGNTCPGYINEKGGFDWTWTQHTAWLSKRGNNTGYIKTLSVFDNGDGRGMEQPAMKSDKYSRAVEYVIDEKNMTIKQTWEFGKQRGFDWYSAVTSNVEYDAKKKTYHTTSANVNLLTPKNTKAVVLEIDPKTNEIKFEMDVVTLDKAGITYRTLVIDPEVFQY